MPSIEDIRTQRKKDKEVLLRMNRACTVLMTSMNISAQELKWERGKGRETYNNELETLIETIANSYRELEKIKIETQFYKDNLDKAKALEDAEEVSPPELITKDDDEVYLMECSPEEFTNHMMDKLSDAQQGG
tara:strand:+ start:895 stop:1293 length:399 start_codon:yes stop_codon:yes gene_type:complete